ncbi:MAG: hypothetical protein A2046_08605 [Bacteroidetes bacterium GWA2_30_7]|nr:MAG: hypothetical protein A2046_08605 [Bacteroidetes bacterium GWA2_30_7]
MKLLFINWAVFSILTLIFTSCSTSSITMKVLVPAQITVPTNIKKLAVANRSLPGKGEKFNNILEGVLTGEGIQVDREASFRCVDGVADVLVSSPRYTVKVPSNLDLRGTGTTEWPIPLEWNEVERICKENDADALIALEIFDSNTGIRYSTKEAKKKVGDKEVPYTEHTATMDIGIMAGWRIYNPSNQAIVDQNIFTDHKFWYGQGEKQEQALGRLPAQRSCIIEAGKFAGSQYGIRISPVWVSVSRAYYTKGVDDFETAKLKVRANQWAEAAEIWQKYVSNSDTKIAGRAAYNMALACEVDGKLDLAIDWAKKSYSEFKNKSARSYMNTLTQRQADQQKLNQQME